MASALPVDSESLQEDFLTCPICCDLFTDPRVLGCQHIFCLNCITRYAQTKLMVGKVQCPTCRQETKSDPPQLKKSLLVNSLMEKLTASESNHVKPRTSESDGSTKSEIVSPPRHSSPVAHAITAQTADPASTDPRLPCELCEKDNGDYFCKECEEYMCESCSRIHAKSRASSTHKVLLAKDVTPEMVQELQAEGAAEAMSAVSLDDTVPHKDDCNCWYCSHSHRRGCRGRGGRRMGYFKRWLMRYAQDENGEMPLGEWEPTPEQREKWRGIRKKWREDREKYGLHHGPPRHGPPHHGPPPHGPPPHGPPPHGPPPHGPPPHGPRPHGPPTHGPPTHGPPTHGPPTHGPPTHGPPPHRGHRRHHRW